MTDRIKEALAHYWGTRCEGEPVSVCPTCAAWAEYDRIEALTAENERLREEVKDLTDELAYHGIYPRAALGDTQ